MVGKFYSVDVDTLYCVGDIHGAFKSISAHIKRFNLENCAIVFCGDIGFGFEKETYYEQMYNHIKKTLKSHNVHCYMLRGNHDDPNYFDGERVDWDYFHAVPDYSVIQTHKHNVLCIGGAVSIDRTLRLQNMDVAAITYMQHHAVTWEEAYKRCPHCWWEGEKVINNDETIKELSYTGVKIDVLCTHTSAPWCEPLLKGPAANWFSVDEKLESDLDEERNTIGNIYKRLVETGHPIKYWCYGHFHSKANFFHEGVQYYLLDMAKNGNFDMVEIRNSNENEGENIEVSESEEKAI